MTSDLTAIDQPKPTPEIKLSEAQVAAYLRSHPEFFVGQDDLIAELSLPHESGKAISLLERQVTVLRERGYDAKEKLGNLLENARSNDQLFETTRNLVLSLLRAENTTELAEAAQDQLADHASIDACEIILVQHDNLNISPSVRTYPPKKLEQNFENVFRLKRTYCGALEKWQLDVLFPGDNESIKSTAVCPAIHEGKVLALLAFGNNKKDYFNLQLDTLFLDFIGNVVGAILYKQLTKA
jgi:uncharacterized protein YigA (DUF484 family)